MTRRRPAGIGQAHGFITETILRNIQVLAIDQAIQEDEEGRRVKVGETATLELTPQQAEIITVAQQMADRLTLSLRSIPDAQEVSRDEADYLVTGQRQRHCADDQIRHRDAKKGLGNEPAARRASQAERTSSDRKRVPQTFHIRLLLPSRWDSACPDQRPPSPAGSTSRLRRPMSATSSG